MKLSEAILRGCEIAPVQCRQVYWAKRDGDVAACAIGAASLAGFDRFSIPLQMRQQIIRENDDLGWTREQIAASLQEAGL